MSPDSQPLQPDPAQQRLEDAWDFIRSPDLEGGLLCLFGAEAAKRGKLALSLLPNFEVDLTEAISYVSGQIPTASRQIKLQRALKPQLRSLQSGENEALVFVDRRDPGQHREGFFRTWALIRELYLAHLGTSGDRSRGFETKAEINHKIRVHSNPMAKGEGVGAVMLGEPCIFTALNPLYDRSHTRHAPVTLYALVPSSSLEVVESPRGATIKRAIIEAMCKRMGLPFDFKLPYVVPDDFHFFSPSIRNVYSSLSKKAEENPGIFTELVLDIVKFLNDQHLRACQEERVLPYTVPFLDFISSKGYPVGAEGLFQYLSTHGYVR